MMPEMDGIEALHRLKAEPGNPNKETPVLVLTANAVSGAREYYISKGFQGYVTKPIHAGTLEETMRKHLPRELLEKAPAAHRQNRERQEGFDAGKMPMIADWTGIMPGCTCRMSNCSPQR